MSIWRRRKTPTGSVEAQEHIEHAEQELAEARAMRVEASEVGAMLAHSQRINHFGVNLEIAIMGRAT